MPRGTYPWDYNNNPNMHQTKSMPEIWTDIHAYTGEFFLDETQFYESIDFFGVIPPVYYQGIFLKGIMFTQGADILGVLCPELRELFHIINCSYSASYPHTTTCDGYFCLFDYPEMEAWFRETYPERSDKVFIRGEESDFVNEYMFMPHRHIPRDMDLLTVSTMQEFKNVGVLGRALKVLRDKYPKKQFKLTWVIGKEFGLNHTELVPREMVVMRDLEKVLKHINDYIHFIPKVPHHELPQVYSRAKCFALPSLLEGRNRASREAMCCNTPVVTFKDILKYTRGNELYIPEGAGLSAPEFDPESMADTIYETITNYQDFTPRQSYLKEWGRQNFMNMCIDRFPVYANQLPGFTPKQHHNNLWLDMAVQHHYGLSLHDYVYGKNIPLSRVKGIEAIKQLVKTYQELLNNQPYSVEQLQQHTA